jgi:protein-tyrosine phosphatase
LELRIESAGLGDWHVGDPPDERAQHHARNRGYDLSAQRARQVRARDFDEFDLILAMDRGHLRALERMAPPKHRAKIRLFAADCDVPDPYYGGAEGFERVLDLVETRCAELLAELKEPTS